MSMLSFLTLRTKNSVYDLLQLDWLTLRSQYKLAIDYYKQIKEEYDKKEAEMRSPLKKVTYGGSSGQFRIPSIPKFK